MTIPEVFKPNPMHAAYIGLVMGLVAFGLALAALGVALTRP